MAKSEQLTVVETARLLHQTAVEQAGKINLLYRKPRRPGKHAVQLTLGEGGIPPVFLIIDTGKGGKPEIHATKKDVWLGVKGVTEMTTGGRLIRERPAYQGAMHELIGDGIKGTPRVSRVRPRKLFYIEKGDEHAHRPVPGAKKSALLIAKVSARS